MVLEPPDDIQDWEEVKITDKELKELNKRIDEEVKSWREISAYSRWNNKQRVNRGR